MTKSWLLFHPDFICGIIVQHHNEHLMAKVTVTLTFDQSLRSRSNVLKNSIWQYLGCYLKHRLFYLVPIYNDTRCFEDPGYVDLDRIGK